MTKMQSTDKYPAGLGMAMDQLAEAAVLAEKLAVEKHKDGGKVPGKVLIDKIREGMRKPKWLLSTTNRIAGGIKHHVFSYVLVVVFELDTQSLLEELDGHRPLRGKQQNEYLRAAEGTESEVREIMVEALLPKAYGLSKSIKVVEWEPITEAGVDTAEVMASTWPVEMTAVDDLVHLDYAGLVNYILGNVRLIDPMVFRENMWVHTDVWRGKKGFRQSYCWDEADVTIAIEGEYRPL